MEEFESYLDIFNSANKIFSINFKTVEEMKEECLYVLDTNILLLPYTVGTKELIEIEKVYSKLINENRIFIPAQVAKEFAKNRPKKLEEIYKSISDFFSKVIDFKFPQYPVLGCIQSYINVLDLEKELNKKVKEYKNEVKEVLKYIHDVNWNDPVSSIYKKLFTENYIFECSYNYKDLIKELENRHKFNIPPAYKDKGKDDKGIGDFIIWKDIQELSKQKNRDIIFVTGDEKADWYHQSMNTKLYPRYELQYEFYTNTNGNHFNIISLSDLIEMFSINNEVVDNIRAVEESNMKYKLGDTVFYKNSPAEIVFCFPSYKHGNNAYTVKFFKGNVELHRLCFEDELSKEWMENEDTHIIMPYEYLGEFNSKGERYCFNCNSYSNFIGVRCGNCGCHNDD